MGTTIKVSPEERIVDKLIARWGMAETNARRLAPLVPEIHRVVSQADLKELMILGQMRLCDAGYLYGTVVGLRTEFKVVNGKLVE